MSSEVRKSYIKTRSRANPTKIISVTQPKSSIGNSKGCHSKQFSTKSSTPKPMVAGPKLTSSTTLQEDTSIENESFASIVDASILSTPKIIPETQVTHNSSNLNTIPTDSNAIRKSLSSLNLSGFTKLQNQRDELQFENEALIMENMEIRSSIAKKDEQLVILEEELNLLRLQVQSLTVELNNQKNASDKLIRTIEILSDDLQKRDEVFIKKMNNIENRLDDVSLSLVTESTPSNVEIKNKKRKKKTTTKKPTIINTSHSDATPSRKVLIIGDSHVRGLGDLLTQRLPSSIQVESCCLPNGKFEDINRCIPGWTEKLKEDDFVFVIGGTNDITSTEYAPNLDFTRVVELSTKCNVILAEIPYRFDCMNLNNVIYDTNCSLYANSLNLKKLELSLFERNCYTRHGLHFNMRGKQSLARQMKTLLFNSDFLG